MRMKIAVILDEISYRFLDSVETVKAVGMKFVELRIVDGKNIAQLDLDDAIEYEMLLEKRGLKVCALASPLFKSFLPGEEREESVGDQFGFTVNDYSSHLKLVEHLVKLAKIFKTDKIRTFTFWKVRETTDEKLEEIAERLKPAVQRFEKEGLKMIVENEPNCYVQTGRQLGRLLELLDETDVGALWDPGNAKLCGEDEDEGFKVLGSRIFHLHVKDFTLEDGEVRFVLPGHGVVNFENVVKNLAEIGYDGFVSFEFIMGGVGLRDLREVFERFRFLVETFEKAKWERGDDERL